MRIHTFDNTTDAYDATQTDESISDGDVLVVAPENVVGFLLEAWPVAVTKECGQFHRLSDPTTPPEGYEAAVVDARDIARVVGLLVEEASSKVVVAQENAARCTCQWADDAGDPEVGPDPYIVEFDNACPHHGVDAMGW